jgi:murein tripeptide amidase MpaA
MPLTSFQLNNGPDHIVFIGGIHGGYEWNTIVLAYRAIDYFTENPEVIPASVTLHIIPSANPDGQFLVTGRLGRFSPIDVNPENFSGRFNGNNVDLNRNWDCNWESTALWRDQLIDAGKQPFSEPENLVLRDFLIELDPIAVVFWHSAANGVFAAGCPGLYQPSYTLATIYGEAAGYPVYERFDSYQVTGDAGDWLALQEIPSISIELINHQDIDWPKNREGMLAVLNQYQQIQR